ncbi:MAG: transposase [Planctomycetota bacterium]|nr:transposase [Planctomycetota bacterium]
MNCEDDHRKKMKRREVPGAIRFITFSCEHRLKLLANPKIADLFVESMAQARSRHGFRLYGWVVMPEHIHMLAAGTDDATLESALESLKKSVATRVIRRRRLLRAPILQRLIRPNGLARFWLKGGGFDHNIRREGSFAKDVFYMHYNPVNRGLVVNPQEWPWSSVHWWLGNRGGICDCDEHPDPGWRGWRGFV